MKIDQHTPGRYICQYGAIYTADGETRIALADRNTPRTTPVERDANMHFLATAPLLLEALQDAELRLVQCCIAKDIGNLPFRKRLIFVEIEMRRLIDTLRDAIAATVYK